MNHVHGGATWIVLTMSLMLVGAADSLEKTAVRIDSRSGDGWDASATCSVTYANTCTGWLWVWNDWIPREVAGVLFEPCCEGASLISTQAYFWTGAPPGWGFTGTLAIQSVVFDCPGEVIDSFAFLPSAGSTVDYWTVPPGPALLTYQNGPAPESPHGIPTDHPAAGPTGPQACGLCYPSTRLTHMFRFGTPNTPLCPGEPLSDGVCDAEALLWYASFDCPVALQNTSWAALKNMYR